MAKGITGGGRQLNYSAKLDITQAAKEAKKFNDMVLKLHADAKKLSNVPVNPNLADLAKQKQEQAKAEKAASLVLQDALKQERLAREAINTQIAANRLAQQQANQAAKEQAEIQKQIANQKRPTQVSNSSAEIAKYNAGTLGTNGQINNAFTAYLREVKKDFDSGKISAQQYVAELERYSVATLASNNATRTQTTTTQAATKSKQELAQIEAINTLRVNENNAARRVAAKEAINEKGSIEQRKAALERLLATYKRLNDEERNTSYGQRMGNTIAQLRVQVKGLEDQTKKMASTSVTSIDQYKASLQRLLAAYTALSKEQRDTVAGAKLAEMIRNLRDQIKGLQDDTKSSKKGIAGVFEYLKNNITSALGAIALLTAAWSAAKSVFSHNIEISDNFTDVQRTAKLSKEEVSEFGKELKKLDTRSSLEGLLDIGFIGGRLSVPKQDLEDFVKQVDELAVVLKKEFPGGAEAVAESLGKIVTIYKITETEGVSLGTALSKVGSTLLELAHSGPVTVKYLQDFTLGVAGTAASAKLSVPVISAYGAVLGESGQIASSAALAITRLVAGLTTKTAKYAAIAQLADSTLTVEKFTKVVNTDTKQALDLFFKGLKAGNPVATEFDGRLGSVGINTGKIMNAVKILANNQDKLTDRIRVSSKAFEEGTSVAHNFELANNNLAASVDKLKNSAVNLTTDPNSSLASFFKGIVDGSTYAIKAISDLDEALTKTQLENDRRIVARASGNQTGKDFLSGLFFGGSAKSNKEVDEARARIRENNSRILNEEIAARGRASADLLANGKKEIELRKLITGEVVKQKIANDRLANALAFVANPKNTGESVETVSRRINKLREAARQQSALVAQLRTKLPKNTEVYGDGSLVDNNGDEKTPATLKAEIKALTAANAKLKVGSKELADGVAKLKALKKELKLALGGKDTEGISAENAALKAAEEFSSKITDLHNSSFRKQISTNEAEIQAIKDKYAKMKDEAVKYYSDPKNTGTAKINGKNISASQVYAIMRNDQEKEITAARYAQGTEALKTSLDEQKQLYTDFEDFKEKFGIDKAKERYGKLIKTDRTYLDQLKIAYSIAIAQGYAGGFTPEVTARMTDLNKNIKLETEAEKKKHDDQLFELQNYVETRKVLQEKMTKKVIEFEKAGNKEKAEEARKYYQKSVLELGENHVQQLESYKRFFNDVEGLTSEEMNKRLEILKTDISKIDSPELKEFLTKLLRAGQIQLNTKTLDGYKSLVSSLQEASAAADGISSGLAEGLGLAVKLGTSMINIKSSYDDFKQANKDNNPLGMLTAGIAGVSSILSIANVVSGIFAKARQFREESKKTIDDFNSRRFIAEFDINALYRERLRTQIEINQATLSGLKTNGIELKKQAQQVADDYNRLADLLSKESYITGYKNEVIKLQVTQVAQLASLAGKNFSDIEKLYMSGQLTDRAKELFVQLQKLKTEGVDIDKLIADNTKSIMDAATGTTADSIRDSIITGFENGYRTAKDFANDFQSLMSSATRQIFKEFIDNQELAAFYKKYAEMAQNGALTVDQKATLKNLYDAMIGRINGKYEELKGITGNDFLADNKNSTNSLKGSVAEQLTEATGTIISGNLSAIQINTKRMVDLQTIGNRTLGDIYALAFQKFQVQLRIEANTYRTAENTTDIPAIKTALQSIDKKMGSAGAALTANGR